MSAELSRRGAVSAALMLALTACADGCAHEGRRRDALATSSRASLEQLEAWTWPDTPDAWQPLAEHELVALEQLVCLLLARAESGRLGPWQRHRAAALAAIVGVELRRAEIAVAERRVELWVVTEPPEDRRGRGSYVIRIGPLRATGGVELLLQAPHSRFDRRTGSIALRMLLELEGPRAVFINSAHRYRQRDGSRTRRDPSTRNPADAAHNPEHPLARTTAQVLEQREVVVVQLHGFARSLAHRDPEMIVSSGVARRSSASTATVERLRASLPEHSCGEFGVDTHRLGARQNVQGWSARATGRCFIHIELSDELRVRLLADSKLRRRFAAAVLEGAVQEHRGGCR